MKKIIQLILSLSLVIMAIVFYKVYFSSNNKSQVFKELSEENSEINNQEESTSEMSNLIRNLSYDVTFDGDKNYSITADMSELTYENNVEIVYMQKVTAIFINENNVPLIITSDKATYNNSSYDTNFSENVRVEYIDNLINSEKLDISFAENIITIYDNVKYHGSSGTLNTDNVKIDLITKNINIYMDNKEKKVEVVSK